jgi:hypothetical protein
MESSNFYCQMTWSQAPWSQANGGVESLEPPPPQLPASTAVAAMNAANAMRLLDHLLPGVALHIAEPPTRSLAWKQGSRRALECY